MERKAKKEYRVGEEVLLEGITSMAAYGGWFAISEIQQKFDEDSGIPYQILKVDGDWYDSRTGGCYSNPNFMYYLDLEKTK